MAEKRNYHEPCTCTQPGPAPCPKHKKQPCTGSKGNCFCLPPKVVPVEVDGCPILFRKVIVPASIGDETTFPPIAGRYRNVLLVYETTRAAYLYSSDGIPTLITDLGEFSRLEKMVKEEIVERKGADALIWEKIHNIELSSDVVDIVGTYAQLQQYDTSKLTDRDIIKVLSDETHGDAIGYYRWNEELGQFQFLGKEGPYYTTTETDALLAGKQNKLTAGYGIDITYDVISGVPFNVTNNDWSNLWQ